MRRFIFKEIVIRIHFKNQLHFFLVPYFDEIVESAVPLSFFACFLVSYYGPNATLIGGVKSEFFHYTPVTNIERFIQNLFLFIAVDFIIVVTSGIFVWVFYKVNRLRM